jgi:gluconolactonase
MPSLSPNGNALSADERILYVAVTRVNQIWPAPLLPDGGRAGDLLGNSGPDGLAATADGGLVVARASLGGAASSMHREK